MTLEGQKSTLGGQKSILEVKNRPPGSKIHQNPPKLDPGRGQTGLRFLPGGLKSTSDRVKNRSWRDPKLPKSSSDPIPRRPKSTNRTREGRKSSKSCFLTVNDDHGRTGLRSIGPRGPGRSEAEGGAPGFEIFGLVVSGWTRSFPGKFRMSDGRTANPA